MPVGPVHKNFQDTHAPVAAHKDGQVEKGGVPPNRQVERGSVHPPAGNRQVELGGKPGNVSHQVELGKAAGSCPQNNEVYRFGGAGRDRPKPL